MARFEPRLIVIVDANEGIVASFGTAGSRGRELAERQVKARAGFVGNRSEFVKVFYVGSSCELYELRWKVGNLGDTFLDHEMLPESARISKGYRESVRELI